MRRCLIIAFIFLFFAKSNAQKIDSNKVVLVDASDVWNRIKNKKYQIDTSKAEVGEPLFTVIPGFGYSQLTGFTVLVDGNISFYTYPKTNISVIKITPEYTQKNQFTPILTASIWSKDNRYNFVSDWRFYKYHVKDFGLGGFSQEDIFNQYNYHFLRFHKIKNESVSKITRCESGALLK